MAEKTGNTSRAGLVAGLSLGVLSLLGIVIAKLEPSEAVTTGQPPERSKRGGQDRSFVNAMTDCEGMVRLAAVSPDIEFVWDQVATRPDTGGTMTLQRSFIARNAFNARINGAYRCEYDAREERVRKLEVRDVGGWRTLLGR